MHQGQIEQMANMGLQLAAEYQDASDAMPSGGYVFKVLFNGKDGMLGFRNWGEVDNFLQGKKNAAGCLMPDVKAQPGLKAEELG